MHLRRWSRPAALGLLAIVLLSLTLRLALSQRGPAPGVSAPADSTGHSQVPRWAFWLQQAWASAELLALLFAAYQLWARRTERRGAEAAAAALALKAANYQAWTVINSAQGKGGSGGRIDALQDLNRNAVSLSGVRLDGAWLEGIELPGAMLSRASLQEANLRGANLQAANLEGANLTGINLTGANLQGAFLKGADLSEAQLGTADLRMADLAELRGWQSIRSVSYLLLNGVRHAPAGFLEWAQAHGAGETEAPPSDAGAEEFSTYFRRV
ncbi:MAG TPA: pentapeptide repeat-containing protein [Gemmatimonadales bacterium]|nr:pentapeptide repeat-containing protein [Gemmatimonadales bacterium]